MPAHVTILYPFVDGSELTPAVRERVAAIAGGFRAFEVTFASAARWPGVVYLEPQPSSRFSALIDVCAAAFPEHPPYAGTISEVIPHLTVAGEPTPAPLDEILAAARGARCPSRRPPTPWRCSPKATTADGGAAGALPFGP